VARGKGAPGDNESFFWVEEGCVGCVGRLIFAIVTLKCRKQNGKGLEKKKGGRVGEKNEKVKGGICRLTGYFFPSCSVSTSCSHINAILGPPSLSFLSENPMPFSAGLMGNDKSKS
jgi:hypothetical protein